jgi:hypothetical protein
MFILATFCGFALSAQCQLATLTNTLSVIHDSHPAFMDETSYQGLVANSQMLLHHDEIITTAMPMEIDMIPVAGPVTIPSSTVNPQTDPFRVVTYGFDGKPTSAY